MTLISLLRIHSGSVTALLGSGGFGTQLPSSSHSQLCDRELLRSALHSLELSFYRSMLLADC